ncbi:MAG: protein kinase [Myxococcota bacterium]
MHLDDDLLAQFAHGELSPSQTREVEEHLASCADCDAVVVELARLREQPSKGRYRIGERLGSGAMGVVFSAWDVRLNRRVALKLLRPALVGPKGEERLLAEARALAKLSHPHVIQVFDVGRWEGDAVAGFGDTPLFISMELVDGWTLRDWLATRPNEAALLDVLEAAGEALSALHQAGLVHRDFKPDNVLIGRDGRVRVNDLGLARAVLDDSEVESFSGTPAYMSPEQRNAHQASAKSDQFAFCVTLVEAFCGSRPGAGETTFATEVPRHLHAALAQGLREDPAERHPTLRALLDVLRAPRPTAHLQVHIAFLVVLTPLHVAVLGWLTVEFLHTFHEPIPEDELDDDALSLAFACIVVMWAPLGTILAPLTAWGLFRRRRWAAITGVIYAAVSLPTVLVTPYSVYALLTLPGRRVRNALR